jgi:hypothetical protein
METSSKGSGFKLNKDACFVNITSQEGNIIYYSLDEDGGRANGN